MTQPEPPQVIIIGLKEVAEDVKKIGQDQSAFVNRFDIYLAEARIRMATLEEDSKQHKKDAQTLRDELALLKQNSVSRGSMWLGIGTLAGVGAMAVGAIALFK